MQQCDTHSKGWHINACLQNNHAKVMEASMLHHMAQDDFDMHQTCYHNKLATITNVAQLHLVDL
jgi:hypothetical protein